MSAEIASTIISVFVSALVSFLVTYFSFRKKDRGALDAELSSILKIGIEHPQFEQEVFTQKWTAELAETDRDYAAYDMYATLVFNFLERYFEFHGFDEDKCLSFLDSRNWILTHKTYWKDPLTPFENKDSYDKRFVKIVQDVIA